jgi:lysophospholipase L1-like esterase
METAAQPEDAVKSRPKILYFSRFYAAYAAVYLFIYLGWIFAGNKETRLFDFSADYTKFVIVMALPFFALLLFRFILKKFPVSRKTALFALAPAALLLAFLYIFSSAHYSWTTVRAFDPFLQLSPVKFQKPAPAAAEEVRVLFLGGSTTEQVGYPASVQEVLKQKYPGKKIEIFNAGRAWYTSRHSLINYVTYYHAWKPDLVVVMHGINDLVRSFSSAQFAHGSYDPLWGHFYAASVRGALPAPFELHLLDALRNLSVLGFSFGTAIDAWYSYFRYVPVDLPLERYVSIAQAKENLKQIARNVRLDGAEILFVTQPSIYKEAMARRELRVLKFAKYQASEKRGWHYEYPSSQSMRRAMAAYGDMVLQLGAEEKIAVADAAAVFPRERSHFVDDVHYSPEGERTLGRYVAERITELDLL